MTTRWPSFLSLAAVSTMSVKMGKRGSWVVSSTIELVPAGHFHVSNWAEGDQRTKGENVPSLMTTVNGIGFFVMAAVGKTVLAKNKDQCNDFVPWASDR